MARPPGKPALAPFGTTIFAEMTALATEHDAVNLGQGFPDTDGPREMLEAAKAAIDGGRNQYPPGPGVPELLAAIAAAPVAVLRPDRRPALGGARHGRRDRGDRRHHPRAVRAG